jgi:hypothetical protein
LAAGPAQARVRPAGGSCRSTYGWPIGGHFIQPIRVGQVHIDTVPIQSLRDQQLPSNDDIRKVNVIPTNGRRRSYANHQSLARSNIPMLPKGQPHTQHYLGSAKDPHAIRLFNEPHPDPTGALGANHPQPRMLLRCQELYEPIPDRDYRENLYESPLPQSALHLLFLCTTKSLLSSI